MRTALRIIFSRYGIVVIILLVVVGALALAQGRDDFPLGSGGSSDSGDEASSEDNPLADDTFDDSVASPECEGEDCEPDSSVHDPFEEVELPDEAVDKALGFAEAWIAVDGKDANAWFQSLQPYMTEDSAEMMRGVDPAGVPATEITGEAVAEGDRVSVPMDTGTLVLTMIEGSNSWADDAWLVSVFDWGIS